MKRVMFVLAALLLLTTGVTAQNAKKLLKEATELSKTERWQEAVEKYDAAIKLDDQLTKAYALRGEALDKLSQPEKALLDYVMAAAQDPKNSDYHYQAGRLYNQLGKYRQAVESLNSATENKKSLLVAYHEKISALMHLRDFYTALKEAETAVSISKTAVNYYNRAVTHDSIGDYQKAAADYHAGMKANKKFEPAYVGYAFAQIKLKDLDKALKTCEELLEINPDNTGAFFARSDIYFRQQYFDKAIADISRVTAIDPTSVAAYMKRSKLYQGLNQHINAINDCNMALQLDPMHYEAIMCRAKSFEALNKYDKAIEDYERLRALAPYDNRIAAMHELAITKLYELHRESNKPEFFFTQPREKRTAEGVLFDARQGATLAEISGWAKDESPIRSIRINGTDVAFKKDTMNPEICTKLPIAGLNDFVVEVTDDYDNVLTKKYTIRWTEVDKPQIELVAPVASDLGEIYLSSNDPLLYIEGQIKDASLISLIMIDGANASFVLDQKNPRFTASIDISNKEKISIRAEDIFGNETVMTYVFNREGAILSETNPMGKTWVVFIDNSAYSEFASLAGPGKDITMMRSALANYEVHNIIVKKDLTKAEMDRFFSIDLRNMIRSNNVNSLLLWYAGHGKFINGTGYWIPIDAKRDDEFGYFNINALKASLQGYANITHTLVITDACESGPSFFQAMRGSKTDRRCDDYTATHFKSSQVFSSAGYELASDNSQFTRTFAGSLHGNPNYCIPIDAIVVDVTAAVTQNKQKPEFGTIQGLEDQNGTFFFVKKR